MKNPRTTVNNTGKVDEFMTQLDHPFKAEVQKIREIIKSVNNNITEQIKWNAPSFSYQGEYLVTLTSGPGSISILFFTIPPFPRLKASCWKAITKTGEWLIFPIWLISR